MENQAPFVGGSDDPSCMRRTFYHIVHLLLQLCLERICCVELRGVVCYLSNRVAFGYINRLPSIGITETISDDSTPIKGRLEICFRRAGSKTVFVNIVRFFYVTNGEVPNPGGKIQKDDITMPSILVVVKREIFTSDNLSGLEGICAAGVDGWIQFALTFICLRSCLKTTISL